MEIKHAASDRFLPQCIVPILWSTNLPLATSTWPGTQETIDRCFRGVSTEVREQVLWKNAAGLYGLPVADKLGQGRE